MSKLSKEGDYDKALDIYYALPELGIRYDTTITNAAISSCDKGPSLSPLQVKYQLHVCQTVFRVRVHRHCSVDTGWSG